LGLGIGTGVELGAGLEVGVKLVFNYFFHLKMVIIRLKIHGEINFHLACGQI